MTDDLVARLRYMAEIDGDGSEAAEAADEIVRLRNEHTTLSAIVTDLAAEDGTDPHAWRWAFYVGRAREAIKGTP